MLFMNIKRSKTKELQRLLIAFHLGSLEPKGQLYILQKQKGRIVSYMLLICIGNARKFSAGSKKKDKKTLYRLSDY